MRDETLYHLEVAINNLTEALEDDSIDGVDKKNIENALATLEEVYDND